MGYNVNQMRFQADTCKTNGIAVDMLVIKEQTKKC
jgi:hypothetical protein